MENQLELKSISKSYQSEAGALDSLHLKVKSNSKIGIVGETGSGKSTLLKVIGGLEQPSSGKVLFEGVPVDGPDMKLIPGHKDIIYLSQYSELPNFISVEQHLDNSYHLNEAEAQAINEACKITHLLQKDTRELSGGEKQRVSFAKALTETPKVLLLDEPFSNLDLIHKKALKEVVDTISHNFDTTILMVTHDARDVLSWADEIIVVKNGTIVQHDRPQVVYRKPVNEYVAGLFGEYSLLPEKTFDLKGIEIHMIKDQLFFRPEAFTLNQKNILGSLECIVVNCAFMGAFYSINLKTTFDFIIYAHSDRPLDLNTRVWLSLV